VQLSVADHDRSSEGLRYVYAVVSRRSGGVSVGVNLNPNNACNWACIYCQVPDLTLGRAPEIDLARLERELRGLLEEIVRGDWLTRRVPEGARRLNDVAFSGNGEPTTSPQFAEAVETVGAALRDFALIGEITLLLITNGTQIGRPAVDEGLVELAQLGGEVWFKLDSATAEGARHTCGHPVDPERHLERLRRSAELCPTWIQTCVFALDGEPPSEAEQQAYLASVRQLVREGTPLRGVQLYGLARPSLQPAADRLTALPAEWLEAFARAVESCGLTVQASV
jgi:wyosine [tRNA(Phe)-imidazoG37] synthetase (radical SAM superfamily)